MISEEENLVNDISLTQTNADSYSVVSNQHTMTFPRSTFQRRSKRLPAVVPEGSRYINDVSITCNFFGAG